MTVGGDEWSQSLSPEGDDSNGKSSSRAVRGFQSTPDREPQQIIRNASFIWDPLPTSGHGVNGNVVGCRDTGAPKDEAALLHIREKSVSGGSNLRTRSVGRSCHTKKRSSSAASKQRRRLSTQHSLGRNENFHDNMRQPTIGRPSRRDLDRDRERRVGQLCGWGFGVPHGAHPSAGAAALVIPDSSRGTPIRGTPRMENLLEHNLRAVTYAGQVLVGSEEEFESADKLSAGKLPAGSVGRRSPLSSIRSTLDRENELYRQKHLSRKGSNSTTCVFGFRGEKRTQDCFRMRPSGKAPAVPRNGNDHGMHESGSAQSSARSALHSSRGLRSSRSTQLSHRTLLKKRVDKSLAACLGNREKEFFTATNENGGAVKGSRRMVGGLSVFQGEFVFPSADLGAKEHQRSKTIGKARVRPRTAAGTCEGAYQLPHHRSLRRHQLLHSRIAPGKRITALTKPGEGDRNLESTSKRAVRGSFRPHSSLGRPPVKVLMYSKSGQNARILEEAKRKRLVSEIAYARKTTRNEGPIDPPLNARPRRATTGMSGHADHTSNQENISFKYRLKRSSMAGVDGGDRATTRMVKTSRGLLCTNAGFARLPTPLEWTEEVKRLAKRVGHLSVHGHGSVRDALRETRLGTESRKSGMARDLGMLQRGAAPQKSGWGIDGHLSRSRTMSASALLETKRKVEGEAIA